ncbi:MAG: phosphoribosyltransferase family protein [Bacilli bacterium]|jgi:ComF family protein
MKPFAKSATKTRLCRLCFETIKDINLHQIFHQDICICQKCQEQFSSVFEKVKICGVNGWAIYDYNDFFQSVLYKLKGCGDIEIAPCFLDYHLPWIRSNFRGYSIIAAPSHYSRDEERGFNQVEEIFKRTGLKMLKALIKTENRKQSDLAQAERAKISDIIAWNGDAKITGKKVLLVDDVMTTGSTIKACINIIKAHSPKSLSVLVISRVADIGER